MPRKYVKKKQEYWDNLSHGSNDKSNNSVVIPDISFSPEMVGQSYYEEVSNASSRLSTASGSRTTSRNKLAATSSVRNRFENIDNGILPWDYSADGVSIRDAIVLSQKAYFNVPDYKSTIDMLAEFADSELYFKKGTGSSSSRKFVEAWFKKIKLYDVKEQFFREYNRSSNVFLLAIEAKVKTKSVKAFSDSSLASLTSPREIPVKYMMLNPADIEVQGQLEFGSYSYAKVLTDFEIAKLRNPKTDKDKELLSALPEEVRNKIQNSNTTLGVNEDFLIPLEIDKIHPVFAKKQDYEPLAIPLGYAVLDDINKKMELKKVDQAIARSIENVILLVTAGAEADKGGINPANLKAMQEIFQNKSVGRVLVADYTTKAEFIIPDLKKVMGKEKYEVLNEDIRNGLNNILLGESKYADTEIKLKIFLQRIEEQRRRFIKDFMQPEIDRVCKIMGLKQPPEIAFKKIDAISYEEMQRLITRMVELGILTPAEGMDVLDKGVFPDGNELGSEQDKFVKEREKGFWSPLANGGNVGKDEEPPAGENGVPKKTGGSPKKPTISSGTGGRPTGTGKPTEAKASINYAVREIKNVSDLIAKFEERACASYKKSLKVKRLSKTKKETIIDICAAVIQGADVDEWDEILEATQKDPSNLITLGVKGGILEIAAEHDLSIEAATVLYHSKKDV